MFGGGGKILIFAFLSPLKNRVVSVGDWEIITYTNNCKNINCKRMKTEILLNKEMNDFVTTMKAIEGAIS